MVVDPILVLLVTVVAIVRMCKDRKAPILQSW